MKILEKGDRGLEVRELQRALRLKEDGVFGPKTEKAVKSFQLKNRLLATGIADYRTQEILFKIDSSLETSLDSKLYEVQLLDDNEYYAGPNRPEYLFLHHTAGWHNPFNVVHAWNKDDRGKIATEFVIGGPSIKADDEKYDGVIVKCMKDGGYAAHLGKNGSQYMHANSVGIEICNFGPLTKKGDEFLTYVGSKVHPSQVYDLGYEFRGHQYWHKYSDKQIEALRKLILFIEERNRINIYAGLIDRLRNMPPILAFEYTSGAFYGKIKGMWSHTNIRKDKFDVFPQKELIDMLLSLE